MTTDEKDKLIAQLTDEERREILIDYLLTNFGHELVVNKRIADAAATYVATKDAATLQSLETACSLKQAVDG